MNSYTAVIAFENFQTYIQESERQLESLLLINVDTINFIGFLNAGFLGIIVSLPNTNASVLKVCRILLFHQGYLNSPIPRILA